MESPLVANSSVKTVSADVLTATNNPKSVVSSDSNFFSASINLSPCVIRVSLEDIASIVGNPWESSSSDINGSGFTINLDEWVRSSIVVVDGVTPCKLGTTKSPDGSVSASSDFFSTEVSSSSDPGSTSSSNSFVNVSSGVGDPWLTHIVHSYTNSSTVDSSPDIAFPVLNTFVLCDGPKFSIINRDGSIDKTIAKSSPLESGGWSLVSK